LSELKTAKDEIGYDYPITKKFTFVLFSSLFLENLTVFILDFSLLSTLKGKHSIGDRFYTSNTNTLT